MKTTQNYVDAISKNHEETQRNTETWIKNLETQIGQISTQLASMSRIGFSGTTLDNPRRTMCKMIVMVKRGHENKLKET